MWRSHSQFACACAGWFHGHAFGLDAQNVEHLIGFRCHLCLRRDPPPRCPPSYLEDAKSNSSILLHEAVNGAETEVADKLPEEAVIAIPMETVERPRVQYSESQTSRQHKTSQTILLKSAEHHRH
ncbi:hypothetical protein Dimus_012084 [Dionaea muscipula]